MKRRFLLFFAIFFLFLNNQIYSQNKIDIIIKPSFEISLSDNGEYIFNTSGKRLVSYLEWKTEPLFKVGIEAEISYKFLYFNIGGVFGVPRECGQMFDSDWISSGIKTTYSIHVNDCKSSFDFFSAIGCKIPIKRFEVIPQFLFNYSYDSFYAHNGYGWYGGEDYSKNGENVPWDSEYARKASKLYPIDLIRDSLNTFLGVTVSYTPFQNFSISAGTLFSFYTYVHSYDYHHADPQSLNDFSMTENQQAFFRRFKETLSVYYIYNDRFVFELSGSYLFGGIIQGELYDDDELTTQKSGSDIYNFSIKISFGIKI